jgi:hypothetical protein
MTTSSWPATKRWPLLIPPADKNRAALHGQPEQA